MYPASAIWIAMVNPKGQGDFFKEKGYSAQPELQLRPRVASLEKGRNFRDVLRALQAHYTSVLPMIT
jgi:hypothetical protein